MWGSGFPTKLLFYKCLPNFLYLCNDFLLLLLLPKLYSYSCSFASSTIGLQSLLFPLMFEIHLFWLLPHPLFFTPFFSPNKIRLGNLASSPHVQANAYPLAFTNSTVQRWLFAHSSTGFHSHAASYRFFLLKTPSA